jgi:hypothetical protein
MSAPSLRPSAIQDVAGAVVPSLLPGAHLAAAALGADQRVVVQRGLPASAAEGARWQAEVHVYGASPTRYARPTSSSGSFPMVGALWNTRPTRESRTNIFSNNS